MLIRLKNAAEIEGFAKAGKIAATILEAVLAEAKPGTTTGELDELAQRLCAEHGVKPAFLGYRGFPGAICASINEEVVHGIPGPRALEEGDILSIDIGTDLDGFLGDTARTIVVGGMPSDLVRATRTALEKAIQAAQPGGRLSDIGEAVAKTAKKNGLQAVLKCGGHGIDRGRLHSDPFVWNRAMHGFEEDVELYPGMVIAIEPMLVEGESGDIVLLEDGWTVVAEGNAAHFEHTIAITEEGPRIMTCQAPDIANLAPEVYSPLFTQATLKV
jgi:methionyl aminopeptidase